MLAVRNTGYGRSKHHLAETRDRSALCGAVSGMHPHHWSHAGEAAAFFEHTPHRICKRCAANHGDPKRAVAGAEMWGGSNRPTQTRILREPQDTLPS